ncbi:MAG: hypothetical protein GDA36_11540 [Rhodobacteraceae bacterium]|nr:hypothetical protein [Paracoccaceae bacterium]
MKSGVHDDLLAGVCRAPQNRAEEEAPDDPPNDPDVHFSINPDARWVKKSSKRALGYKMASNGVARPDEESFIDKFHTGSCEPGRETRVLYDGQRGKGVGGDWPTKPVPARPTCTPCAVATVTGSCEQLPVIRPSSIPACPGKRGGKRISKRRLMA